MRTTELLDSAPAGVFFLLSLPVVGHITHQGDIKHSVYMFYTRYPLKFAVFYKYPYPERRIVNSPLLWSDYSSLPYNHWNLIAIQEVLRTGTFLKSCFNWHMVVRTYETQCYTLIQVYTMECLDEAEGVCITASIFCVRNNWDPLH